MSGNELLQFSLACWVVFACSAVTILALIMLLDTVKSLRLALKEIRNLADELRRPDTVIQGVGLELAERDRLRRLELAEAGKNDV